MPSRLSITSKAAAAAGLMFVLLVWIAALTYSKSEQLMSSMRWMTHTSDVLARLEKMNSALHTVEASQRGYIISGDEHFLDQCRQSSNQLESLASEVAQLIKDNARQRERITEFRRVLNEKLQFVQTTIDLRRKHDDQTAEAMVTSMTGQRLGEQLSGLIGSIEQEEHSLLEQRAQEVNSARDATISILAVLVLLAFAMFFSIIWLVRNYARNQEFTRSVLEASESRLRAILSSLGEGVCQVDRNGAVVYFNAAAEKLLGFKLEETKSKNIHELVHSVLPADKSHSAGECSLMQVVKNGEAVKLEQDDFGRVDTTLLPVESSAVPMHVDGKLIGAVISFQDVTHRQAAQKRVSEFYSTVSHELRTPLTSIRAALGLIEGGVVGELSEKASRLVRIARTESDRLIRLINDILDIRKIEAGKLELIRELIPVRDLVDLVIETNASVAAEAGVKLIPQVECGGEIIGDRDRIIQVFMNLISNAVKFSPRDSEVIVRAQRLNGNYRFSVIDSGPGIQPDQLHKLFGWFQQVDSSDTRTKGGTGLGLAISKGIIEQHGGTIGVESNVGAGSTFWIELPGKVTLLPKEETPGYSGGGNAKVLLIEDDTRLSELVSATVAQYGYEVATAGTIADAQKALHDDDLPSVILLDISLPDGNGLELMQAMRKVPKTQNIPIVVLTGRQPDMDIYAEPLLIDWITKPFDEKRLIRALKTAVRGLRPAKVLIVEDDEPTRQLLVEQLLQLGVATIEAPDGAVAIQLVRNENPDLIILDIGIPAPDGFDVVKILRQEKSHKTPLLIYTSRDLTSEDIQALSLGLSKYLVKSRTTQEQFLASVRDLLNGLIAPEVNSSGK